MFLAHRNAARAEQRALPSAVVPINLNQEKGHVNTHVDAAFMPAGKTVTKSARRTPRGESSRQRPGKSSIGAILPIQRLNTPVVMLTFSSSDQVLTYKENKPMIVARQR